MTSNTFLVKENSNGLKKKPFTSHADVTQSSIQQKYFCSNFLKRCAIKENVESPQGWMMYKFQTSLINIFMTNFVYFLTEAENVGILYGIIKADLYAVDIRQN